MRRLYAKSCELDKDYARYARFYIANSKQFYDQYTLYDAVEHILSTLQSGRLLLFDDEQGELAGYVQYRYETDAVTVFIDSAILASEYRSSRAFYRGFIDLVKQIDRESKGIQHVRLHALADHAYLNRLYGKFSRRIGEREGLNGREYVYETEFSGLLRYLRADVQKT